MPAHSGPGSIGSMGTAGSEKIRVKIKPSSSMGQPPSQGGRRSIQVAAPQILPHPASPTSKSTHLPSLMEVKEEPEFGGFPAAPKQPTSPTMEASPSGMKVASPAPTGDAAEGKKKRSHKRRKVEDIPAKLQVSPPFSQPSIGGVVLPDPQPSAPAPSPSPESLPIAKKKSGLKISMGGLGRAGPKPSGIHIEDEPSTLYGKKASSPAAASTKAPQKRDPTPGRQGQGEGKPPQQSASSGPISKKLSIKLPVSSPTSLPPAQPMQGSGLKIKLGGKPPPSPALPEHSTSTQAASLAAPSGGSGRIETAEERAERKRLEKLIKLESRKDETEAEKAERRAKKKDKKDARRSKQGSQSQEPSHAS